MNWLIILGCLGLTLLPEISAKVLMCYWNSQSHYRPDEGRFSVEDIDPDLCTHIIYQAAVINSRTFEIQSGDRKLDYGPTDDPPGIDDMFRKVINLKTKNSGLQVFLSVGGAKLESKVFSDMANVPSNRKLFIDSVVELLTEFKFDGLDVDWQYPTLGFGSRPKADRANFVTLVQELKDTFDKMEPPRKLTIMVPNLHTEELRAGYDFSRLSKQVGFLNVKAFDYKIYSNKSNDAQKIAHHSELYPSVEDNMNEILSLKKTINYVIDTGTSMDKIVVGLATFGRTYTLSARDKHNIGDLANGPGIPFQFTKEAGKIAYFELCLNLAGIPGWDFVFNIGTVHTYAYNSTQWIGFDDVDSVNEKVDWSTCADHDLAGVSVMTIDLDDCKNYCEGWETTCRLTQLIKDRLDLRSRVPVQACRP